MSDRHSHSNGWIAFFAGAAIGAGLGLLFAPRPGKVTREKIKEASEKMVDNVKDAADKAIDKMKSFVEGAKQGMKMEIKEELEDELETPSKKKARS